MRNINIKDIARLAGVGVSTVSRVMNQHPDVKAETRENVLRIIEEYNYIPNNSARNLKRTETADVGILIKGLYNPFFAQMLGLIENILSQNGYGLLSHYNGDNSASQLEILKGNEHMRDIDIAYEFIMEKKLCGLICLGGDFNDVREHDLLRLGVPLIVASTNIDESIDKNLYSSVAIDNERAAFDAVSYLCNEGHQHIGIITTGAGDLSIGTARTRGYMNALREHHIDKNELYFDMGAYTFETAYEAMNRLLDKAPELTAVFAISDIMAIGASKAILDRGLKIPDDLSIIGFDDIDYAAFFNPSLTTVRQPVREIAISTGEIMVELLELRESHKHVQFPTQLMIRDSSCVHKEMEAKENEDL
ncbi:LacI family DNA-binding transcriptional regulator [Fusibacter sp. 3D3]|uniref:LacI family DNA-binding transcriptional regulator n=1 Tax=Fusibacter sp. 3D3 TaxID=1048380 RepID=UPI000852E871|nr:LacI family DNA-binding transcriptional regulator [Fusibacter sp. 3D3]GAU79734.1 maltose operon transcriptional repressor MalR [Fusibacter sp. 3D3]